MMQARGNPSKVKQSVGMSVYSDHVSIPPYRKLDFMYMMLA